MELNPLKSGVGLMFCGLAWLVGCEKPMQVTTVERPGTPNQSIEVVKADVTAGKAVYDGQCANCHRLGDYDKDGNEENLAGRRKKIRMSFVDRHVGGGLSQTEVDNLQAFIGQY